MSGAMFAVLSGGLCKLVEVRYWLLVVNGSNRQATKKIILRYTVNDYIKDLIEVACREERAALKKMVEGKKKIGHEIMVSDRPSNLIAIASYNTAINDILNELK